MSVNLAFIIFYLVMFELLIQANEFSGLIILTISGGLWSLQFFTLSNRSIFIKMDTKKKKVYFGNLFFKNDCEYKHVNRIKSSWLPNLYWINIGAKKYNFYAVGLDLKGVRQTLELKE